MGVVAAGGVEGRNTNLGTGVAFYGVRDGSVIHVDIVAAAVAATVVTLNLAISAVKQSNPPAV